MRKLALDLGLLALGLCTSAVALATPVAVQQANAQPPGHSGEEILLNGKVTLFWDLDGAPHVYGPTMNAVYFGLGYAQAIDRLFQMDYSRKFLQGRLAEFYERDPGSLPDRAIEDYNDELARHDERMRTIGYARHDREVMPNLPPEIVANVRAFTDGVNRYIREIKAAPTLLPPAYGEYGLTAKELEFWRPADCLHCWSRIGYLFGRDAMEKNLQGEIDNLEDLLLLGRIPHECENAQADCSSDAVDRPMHDDAATVPDQGACPTPPPGSPLDLDTRQISEFFASHAWAVRGTGTTTGKPVLVADPKIEVMAPSIFYPFHLTVIQAGDVTVNPPQVTVTGEIVLNVRGAGIPGTPAAVLLWNEHGGHAATAAGGVDMADLYQLQRVDCPPEILDECEDCRCYRWDGEMVPIRAVQERILRKYGEDEAIEVEIVDDLGPVVGQPSVINPGEFVLVDPSGLIPPDPDRIFALRELELTRTSTHSMVAAMNMALATKLDDYVQSLADWAKPAVNLIYAGVDSDSAEPNDPGNIAYFFGAGLVERVANIEQWDGAPHDVRGRFPYDGTGSSELWVRELGPEERPNVVNPSEGYVYNGNNMPIGSWYDTNCLGGYSGIIGVGHTFRSFNLERIFAELYATPGTQLTPDQIYAIHCDVSSRAVEVFHRILDHMNNRGLLVPVAQDDGVQCTGGPTTLCPRKKAYKVWEALTLWMNEHSPPRLDRTSAYAPLVDTLLDKLERLSCPQFNLDFSCTWNHGQGGACQFLSCYEACTDDLCRDQVLDITGQGTHCPGSIEIDFVLDCAADAWDFLPVGAGLDENPALWVSETAEPQCLSPGVPPVLLIPTYRAMYQVHRVCNNPCVTAILDNFAESCCSLDVSQDVVAELVKPYKNTLNSGESSAMPTLVDFSAVDGQTRQFLPPGNAEDPASVYDRALAVWQMDASCDCDLQNLPGAPIEPGSIVPDPARVIVLPYNPPDERFGPVAPIPGTTPGTVVLDQGAQQ